MKSHIVENMLPSNPRFHLPRADGLYLPIPFLFVSARMRQDILFERQAILIALTPELKAGQEKLFRRFDPNLSFQAFDSILRVFGLPR
jgi:hypothetical protein